MDRFARGNSGAVRPGPEFTTLTLDRRRFLVMLGGAAAATLVVPRLSLAAREPGSALASWTLPEQLPAGTIESARALIGAAILAPSFWNAQPWRFEVDGAELRLTLDSSRAMPFGDPDQRFTQMSLGAALENLLVAARAWGQQPNVQYLPWGPAARAGAPLVAARVTWQPAEARRDRVLFGALAERRTNPRNYDGRAITMQSRAQLLAQVPDELRLHWLDDRASIRAVGALVHDAIEAIAGDARAQAERARWVRSGEGDARRHGDGMAPERLGLGGPLGWFTADALSPGHRLHGWAVGSWSHAASDAVRSSGALALLTAPKRSDATALIAGQAYERLALTAATLGISQQPLAAPVASERHRGPLLKRFGAAGEEPLLLVRFGHAHAPDPTPRRAVALVSTYRAS